MNFSSDRDLLVLEPGVFEALAAQGHQRVSVADAAVTGVTLTSAAADFAAGGVEAGFVALINGMAHEVVARVDAHTLTVSLPRARLSEAPAPGVQGSNLPLVVRTFSPQAKRVHDNLLQVLGIDPDAPDPQRSEDQIVSLAVMSRLEALGTLERLYSAALALDEDYPYTHALVRKAIEYRRRFSQALRRSVVLLDRDGDGKADTRLDLGRVILERV